jgi:hypothetical protein
MCRGLHLTHLQLRAGISNVEQNRQPTKIGHNLLQDPETLASEFCHLK